MARDTQRFNKLIERGDDVDFPFYNFLPEKVATWKWIVIILACVIGFGVISLVGFENQLLNIIPRVLFTAIPFITFAALVKPNWRAIFRPLKWADVAVMMVFWLLTLALSALAAFVVSGGDPVGHFAANSATDTVLAGGAWGVIGFYLGTFIQLFGEELVTILPFLAVLYWLHSKTKLSRKTSIFLAWIITAVWFGALHLPTYGWNVVQAIVLIGVARLALTMAFIRTKKILVSFGAHLINDWATFTLALVAAAAVIAR